LTLQFASLPVLNTKLEILIATTTDLADIPEMGLTKAAGNTLAASPIRMHLPRS
jgi:hypothetical protein